MREPQRSHVFRLLVGLVALLALGALATPAARAQSEDVSGDIDVLIRASKARAAIVRQVSPAVVHISVTKTVSHEGGEQEFPFDDEFFRRFFGPRLPVPPREFRQRGLGTGSIVDERGYILTNNHVVENADKITVKTKDGRELDAELVGTDPATDLAVVKVQNGEALPTIRLGNSEELEVGETVLAIGNPFGLEQTVTQGIVSAKGRSGVGLTDYEDFIQTDAPINPGNSGGPLVNLKGEIVGVNTAIFSRSGGNMGIGFAIPINMARQIMTSLIETGRVTRGFLGVVIQDVTPDLAEAMGVDVNAGVLIANVGDDTPAGRAGIQQGDIVTRFNERPVKTSNELRNVVAAVKPGTSVPVTVLRDGRERSLEVTVGEQPEDMRAAIEGAPGPGGQAPQEPAETPPEQVLGMQVETLTPDLAGRLGYRGLQGVVVTAVESGTPAAEAGLRQGALIMEVNRKPVRNVREFRAQISAVPSGRTFLMLVRVGQASRFIGIRKP